MSLRATPGDWEIAVVDVETRETHTLTSNAARDAAPTWSPDGRRIAFASDRDGFHGLFVVDASGGAPVRLATQPAATSAVQWSPQGRDIVFAAGDYGSRRILTMGADGGGLRALLTGGEAPATASAP